MFITYEGNTVTLNELFWDHTASITYTNSDGEEVTKLVCQHTLVGGDFPLIDWNTVMYDGLMNRGADYWDYEFSDDDPRRLINLSYSKEHNSWYGTVLFSKTSDGDFDYGEVAINDNSDIEGLKKLIPPQDCPPDVTPVINKVYVVTNRWDQYSCMDTHAFSSWSSAKELFDQLVSEYDEELDNMFGSRQESFLLRENLKEGIQVRLEALDVK